MFFNIQNYLICLFFFLLLPVLLVSLNTLNISLLSLLACVPSEEKLDVILTWHFLFPSSSWSSHDGCAGPFDGFLRCLRLCPLFFTLFSFYSSDSIISVVLSSSLLSLSSALSNLLLQLCGEFFISVIVLYNFRTFLISI